MPSRDAHSRYAQWMYDWEVRLTSVDNNRVVRPLEWGVEWARDWPCRNGTRPGQTVDDPAKFFIDFNRRIVAASDDFYSYKTPTDFRLEKREVKVFSTREVPDMKLAAKVKGTFAEFLRFRAPGITPYPPTSDARSMRCARAWWTFAAASIGSSSRAMTSSELWAQVWAPVMPSLRLRTSLAFGSRRSIM